MKNFKKRSALLALSSGELFWGVSIGSSGCVAGEIVFNTAMTGYQEILTDPSYAKQLVAFTYPHIGNVGINPEDAESSAIWPSGLILREKPCLPSNYRSQQSFQNYCINNQIVCIAGIDTRHLTHLLREKGLAVACLVAGENIDSDHAITTAKAFDTNYLNFADLVSTKQPYQWIQGSWSLAPVERHLNKRFKVLVYDFGVKRSILRKLVDIGCEVIVIPAHTAVAEALSYSPHGIVFSNGPGDPRTYLSAIQIIKQFFQTNIPLLGICLGFQLIALAAGAKVIKMKVGHHGANHPVQCIKTKKIFITSQNHGFALDENNLPPILQITHRSLFDNTVQGIEHVNKAVLGFQGHPEGAPGPSDMTEFYSQFMSMMFRFKNYQNNFSFSSVEF